MNYQVFTPCQELQPFVKCFWTLEDEASDDPVKQRVIPDGCMEMIFHYRDLYKQFFEDGTSIVQPRSFVFGQITNYIEIAPTGASGIVAARFLPDGLLLFLDMPITDLENKAVEISIVFGEHGKVLERNILSAKNNAERIQVIESFLLSLLADPKVIDTITKSCVQTIFESQGKMGVNELADKMNVHRRSMERKFISVIGISPKQLSRVARLQSALKILLQEDSANFTSVAHETGYYDQAHFIKDFKEFTGLSPKSFFADNLALSSLFIAAE